MGAVVKAVAITAATSVIVVGIVMYVIYRVRGQQVKKKGSSFRREGAPRAEFRPHGAALKGVIVEEQGLDVLYLRQLHGSGCFNKVWYNPMMEDLKRMNPTLPHPIHETPLLLQQSTNLYEFHHNTTTTPPSPPLQPPPPPPPPPPIKAAPPPPPPPGPPKLRPAPPPQPAKKVAPSHKPPMAPRIKENRLSRGEADGVQTTKLKPLHWDKVMANSDHSMVWNEINDGSFRVDDELMEALFGYTSDHKSTAKNKIPSNRGSSTATQTFILEPRKSQNTAIILKSLPISREEILDSLMEGRGLNADTLEKLTRICPTQEETTKILQFNGDPTKLADAESFLHHILTAVPTAFVRFNAMLFRANYDYEILHLKESLQACELGCKELRSGGIFFKLLEAILKAGNRMNAGTNRGNAQGFNLTALRRLSDVKSTDGKTTLLHFVVEQVVRSEGKRRLKKWETEEEAERECVMVGLQALESLNSEFSNVKKAAGVDYESMMSASSVLTARAGEIKVVLKVVEAEGFAVEMKGFLEECEAELRVVREEERRVVEVVKRTTVYYEMGLKGGNPLQLFVIVKDFLNNVEQVCWEMRKRLQKIKVGGASPTPRSPVKFENLQNYLKAQRVGTSWSDSDDDF